MKNIIHFLKKTLSWEEFENIHKIFGVGKERIFEIEVTNKMTFNEIRSLFRYYFFLRIVEKAASIQPSPGAFLEMYDTSQLTISQSKLLASDLGVYETEIRKLNNNQSSIKI